MSVKLRTRSWRPALSFHLTVQRVYSRYLWRLVPLLISSGEGELLEKMISEAKKIGADGIIMLAQDGKTGAFVPVGRFWIPLSNRIVRGSAIVYTGTTVKVQSQTGRAPDGFEAPEMPRKGLTMDTARAHFGDPISVHTGKDVVIWVYAGGRQLRFGNGRLERWIGF
jgi:hypothetical protein